MPIATFYELANCRTSLMTTGMVKWYVKREVTLIILSVCGGGEHDQQQGFPGRAECLRTPIIRLTKFR